MCIENGYGDKNSLPTRALAADTDTESSLFWQRRPTAWEAGALHVESLEVLPSAPFGLNNSITDGGHLQICCDASKCNVVFRAPEF